MVIEVRLPSLSRWSLVGLLFPYFVHMLSHVTIMSSSLEKNHFFTLRPVPQCLPLEKMAVSSIQLLTHEPIIPLRGTHGLHSANRGVLGHFRVVTGKGFRFSIFQL